MPSSSPPPSPAQLEAWDLAHLWHPFTQADEWEADAPPLVIAEAQGVELIDVHGRRYLDGVSSLWTNVHGHRHPVLDAALRAQLDRVAHSTLLGLSAEPAVRLARALVERVERQLPEAGLTRVFYSDSGSTAVEVALKMAFQWQQQRGHSARRRIAALAEAYHGDTIGSVSVGGIDLFHAIYRPLLFDCVRLPAPSHAGGEEEAACLRACEELLATHGPELAAIVVEPLVQGAAGMRMHSPAFLRRLLDLAHQAGVLVVVDEVATGFGRTGTLFAMEQVGPLAPGPTGTRGPDLLCIAKGLSGGYLPLAATLVSEGLYDGFRGPYTDYRTLFHGHTFTGNALGCAVALASLEVFDQERVLEGLPARISALTEAMARVPDHRVVERRQHGLMAGLLLRHAQPAAARVAHRVCMAARRHGVIVRPLGDLIVLMPPLAMTPAQIHQLVDAVQVAIEDVLG